MKYPLFFSFLFPVITLFNTTDHQPAKQELTEKTIVLTTDGDTQEFTDANFQKKVLSADKLTLVDFWATWCGPCRAMGPVVEELAKDYSGKVNVGKLNVDQNPNICGKYNVTSIPTILFIKNGKVVDRVVGVYPKSRLEKKIKAHL
ncbi:thioredoxin [Niastella vici]|uniref:thioredoxin n=1 Tax=Niastella vici TaxID=1703345 RepID=UPI0009C0D673|nr:thioredoxin [Niastella vici]